MEFTSKERVIAALNHSIPDRIPAYAISIDIPGLAQKLGFKTNEQLYKHLGFDLRTVLPRYIGGPERSEGTRAFECFFFNKDGGASYSDTLCSRPLQYAQSVRDVECYSWPDPKWWDYGYINKGINEISEGAAIIVDGWNPVFCQLMKLFGMETCLMNLVLNPSLIEAALEYIEDFYLDYYKRLFEEAKGKALIFSMGDDFASQRGMLISPDAWRKFFKPVYKKIFDLAKSYNFYVWFHSCGTFREVLPDMIDIGMDVWETVQAHLPGNEPEILKREYGKDITFFGGISTQNTLPYGSPEDVRKEVRERIKILGRDGGYICGADHHIKEDVSIENVLALYSEVLAFRYEGCTF